MILKYSYNDLGLGCDGRSRYHFTFARYYNPTRLGFGHLRVLNDDVIPPKSGFDPHQDENAEIITYVKKGALRRKNAVGDSDLIRAGEIHVTTAGTGVSHQDDNPEEETTELYHIRITPNKQNVEPRNEKTALPKNPADDALPLLVSGREEDKEKGAVFICQDAAIYGGTLQAGTRLTHPIKYQAYILAVNGAVTLNDTTLLEKGDGAEVENITALQIRADTDAEILVIDVPPLE